jgi:CRISPR-associated protein Cas5 subtype I-B
MKRLVSARLLVPFWCSFRIPYTINVNFSYPVPPPITLFGLIGCALGIPADSFDLLSEMDIAVGLEEEGEIIETYSRIIKRDARTPDRRTLLIRQKLLQPVYRLYLLAGEELAETVAKRLTDPVYPLALGESDDMLEVDQVLVSSMEKEDVHEIDSILPVGLGLEPISEHIVSYLPIAFKRGKRDWTGVEYRSYFVGQSLVLNQEIQAYIAGDKRVVF